LGFKISDDVVFRVLDREAVILSLSSGVYFGLDKVGTRIWQLIAEGQSTDRTIETLLEEYDAREEDVRWDFEALTRQLMNKGLVQSTPTND
jgi:hypothetical protein